MADIIDINISPVIETVALTIQPNLTTINVNTVTGGGGAVSSVNSQTGDVVLDQDDILDGTTYKQYSLTEKNKLAGIQAGAEVNVNADWNAVSGDAQILNKPTIPSITNLVPYTGATQNVDLGEFELKAGQLTLDTTPTGTAAVTTTRWNDTSGVSETTLKGGSVILKNGIDLVARVVNKVNPNTTLTKANYQVVRISGAQGQRLAVELAQANNDNNSADTLGIVIETIAANQEGFIMTVGQLEGINTTGSLQGETWTDGDVLYLSPTTAGRLTNIKPTGATGHIVVIGYVEHAHITQGKIYVKIMNGWELDELHNVYISSVADKQLLSYDSATSLWKNKSVTTADIADSTNKRYVTDANLVVIGNTSGTNTGDNAVNSLYSGLATSKQDTLVSGTNIKTIEGQSILGSGNIDLSKSDVGLGNVDNTSDANKPISTATQTALNAKENTITAGTTSQYYRGDKTFQTLDKSAVGLGNVDNTSDANKPVSTAQQTAIDAKVADSITDGVTTIAPSQNAVFDALALKQNILAYTPYRSIQTSQTVHTGTTVETVLFTATIPAGAFNATDIIKVLFGTNKLNVAGTYSLRLRVNTTNTISGAPTIALYSGTNTAQVNVMMRNFNLNGGNLYGFPFLTSGITDIVALGASLGSTTLNPANQFFIFATVTLNNSLDNFIGNMLSISN